MPIATNDMNQIYVPVRSVDLLGVDYWFRTHGACSKFANQNNSIYPHLPYLKIQTFVVWHGMPTFNPMTYVGDAIIISENSHWYAVPAITRILDDQHYMLLWRVKLRFMQ